MVSKKNIFKIAAGILALSLAILSVPLSSAFGKTGFRAGNIISDANMYQKTPSMSATEIQKFLETQGAGCRGNGCLKNMRLNTRSFNADNYCKGSYRGANNEPVSQVIFKISQACQISPKVLLVTIQKEQSGITRNLSTVSQNKLTGYGCPDGKPCNEQYYGVQNQIYQTAHQLQRYRLKPGYYSYRGGKTANIKFSYQNGCGASTVRLENQATASLYNYTPYQPNQALLSGKPDRCSSDGNYNFFNIYQRWFGDPRGSAPAATPNKKVVVPEGGYTGTSNNTKAQAAKEQTNSSSANQSSVKATQPASKTRPRGATSTASAPQAPTNQQPASGPKPANSSQNAATKAAGTKNVVAQSIEQDQAKQAAKAAEEAAQTAAKAAPAKKATALTQATRAATPVPAATQKEKPTQPNSKSPAAKPQNDTVTRPQSTGATPNKTKPAKATTKPANSNNDPDLASTGTLGGTVAILSLVLVIAGWRIRKNVIDNRPIRVNC